MDSSSPRKHKGKFALMYNSKGELVKVRAKNITYQEFKKRVAEELNCKEINKIKVYNQHGYLIQSDRDIEFLVDKEMLSVVVQQPSVTDT